MAASLKARSACGGHPSARSQRAIALLLALTPALMWTPLAMSAQTTAEQLGYPPGKRVLILHAAQLGMCHETNQAGQRCLENGWVQSASVMPTCPWFHEFAQWRREHPGGDVGLGLVLNSEWSHYRWRPVAPRTEVPSLVDSDGYLWQTVLQFSINARSEDVAREIEAQLQHAFKAGIRPTHLLPHLGAILSRPELAAAYLKTAQKLWIPAVVVELTPERVAYYRAQGTPLDVNMIEIIHNYHLPKLDDLKFIPAASSYEEKRQLFYETVRGLAPGIAQIMAQPAAETDALKSITENWQQRVWDDQLLADPAVHQFLADQQILFSDWVEIMRRFEGELPVRVLPAGRVSDSDDPPPTER